MALGDAACLLHTPRSCDLGRGTHRGLRRTEVSTPQRESGRVKAGGELGQADLARGAGGGCEPAAGTPRKVPNRHSHCWPLGVQGSWDASVPELTASVPISCLWLGVVP